MMRSEEEIKEIIDYYTENNSNIEEGGKTKVLIEHQAADCLKCKNTWWIFSCNIGDRGVSLLENIIIEKIEEISDPLILDVECIKCGFRFVWPLEIVGYTEAATWFWDWQYELLENEEYSYHVKCKGTREGE